MVSWSSLFWHQPCPLVMAKFCSCFFYAEASPPIVGSLVLIVHLALPLFLILSKGNTALPLLVSLCCGDQTLPWLAFLSVISHVFAKAHCGPSMLSPFLFWCTRPSIACPPPVELNFALCLLQLPPFGAPLPSHPLFASIMVQQALFGFVLLPF